ncbi:MAG: hypothetical protein HY706_00250 [Candidatus Hydrogenedentes bacterium]|nr:hypothetical protein [Candidatus Hydrogenedentota bacterium]
MRSDPIVDQVRRTRRQIEQQIGSDAEAFYRHLRKIQKAYGQRVVCRKPKRLVNPTRQKRVS